MLKMTLRMLLNVMITFAVAEAQKPQSERSQRPVIPFPKQGLYVKQLEREAQDIWSEEILDVFRNKIFGSSSQRALAMTHTQIV